MQPLKTISSKFPFHWYYITPPQCIKSNRAIAAAKGYISGDEVPDGSGKQLEKI